MGDFNDASDIVKNDFHSSSSRGNEVSTSPQNLPVFLACSEVQKSGKVLGGENVPEKIGDAWEQDSSAKKKKKPHWNKKNAILYDQSIKISGNVIKVNEYGIPQWNGRTLEDYDKPEKIKRERTPEEQAEDIIKNGNRARNEIIDTVNSNWGMCPRGNFPDGKSVKVLHLTYKENMMDVTQAHKDYVKLIDRLEYHLGEKVEYLAVPEPQERGAIHIHAILYSSFIHLPWLLENWNENNGQGSFKINKVNLVQDLGKYVAKYVSKTLTDGQGIDGQAGLTGRHRYWKSKGLKNKTVKLRVLSRFSASEVIDLFWKVIGQKKDGSPKIRRGEYFNEYTGNVTSTEIVLIPCKEAMYWIKELIAMLQAEPPKNQITEEVF